MLKKISLLVAFCIATCMPSVSSAQQLIGSYVARLSEADHFNSQGQRLTTAAAIIRQDRANYYRFGIRDPEDQPDPFFSDERNRATLEQMLERGHADPGVISQIVNGTPLIRVDIYRNSSGPFIRVTVSEPSQSASSSPPSPAPNNSQQTDSYWFVANTEPPDAYLALRTAPTSQYGQRIAMMPNGTLLQVLEQRPDRWWLVRVVGTGQQGWALSGEGNRIWIECCQTVGGNQAAASKTVTTEHTSSEESSGTGFFVAPHLVLTNNHVIKSCGEYPITVAYPDRRPEKAFIAGQDDTNDLVLLQTDLPNGSVAAFRFGPRVGEQVAAYGFPLLGLLSTSGNFTLGNVTALAGMQDDTRVLQTSTPVQPGNSGGPLLDMSGSVVGVIESQLDALAMIKVTSDVPQNVNFAIQTPIVINFLTIKGASPSLAGNERKILDPADVANLAKDFTVQVVCQPTAK